ncbi:MAG: PqqD family protein [Polyangiaceae bacterium]|nr:PqqD family protein [Polyangiaceae bacterium]
MNDTTRIARSKGVLSRTTGGEAILLDTVGGAYFGLNTVGARAWEIIGENGTTRGALIEALLAEHEVTRDVLTRDVDDLLTALEKRRLVQLS